MMILPVLKKSVDFLTDFFESWSGGYACNDTLVAKSAPVRTSFLRDEYRHDKGSGFMIPWSLFFKVLHRFQLRLRWFVLIGKYIKRFFGGVLLGAFFAFAETIGLDIAYIKHHMEGFVMIRTLGSNCLV